MRENVYISCIFLRFELKCIGSFLKVSDFVQDSLKYGVKLYGKLIVANILCFIIVFSISFIAAFLFSEEIGYKVSGVSPDGTVSDNLYTHYYADGDDLKYAEYVNQGYELNKLTIRSGISGGARLFLQIASQICGLGILISFIYPMFKDIGGKDRNAVNFGRIKEDKLKGFKSGLFTIIPVTVVTLFFILTKSGITAEFSVSLYIFFNSSFYGIMDILTNHQVMFKDVGTLNLVLIILVQLIIPIIAHVAYTLGYRDVSVSDRLIYKDKV